MGAQRPPGDRRGRYIGGLGRVPHTGGPTRPVRRRVIAIRPGVAAAEDASHGKDTHMETVMNATTTPRYASRGATARRLALGSLIGPVVFTLAWIVLGVLQPSTLTSYGVM